MIPLIPYQRWAIYSSLSRDEAVTRLSSRVWRRIWFVWFPSNPGGFEGTVSENGFCINRIIKYRNSFLPYLWGKFFQEGDRLRIEMIAAPHPAVVALAIFSVFLIALVGKGSDGNYWAELKGIIAIASLIYMITMSLFIYELQKMKVFIADIFL